MAKVMTPGRPGDLVTIFRHSLRELERLMHFHEETGTLDAETLVSVALIAQQALRMWLGEIPIPDAPAPQPKLAN